MESVGRIVLLAAEDVGSGKISGGWEYVWASWIITWVVVAAYAAFLWSRSRALKQDGRNGP